MNRLHIIFLIIGFYANCTAEGRPTTNPLSFQYYSATITLYYEPHQLPSNVLEYDELFLKNFYKNEKNKNQSLVQQLQQIQKNLNLNGWLYYKLVSQAVRHLCPTQNETTQKLFIWVLMNESGYDVRLTRKRQRFFLQAFTQDELFEIPFFELEGKTFVNLTAIENPSYRQMVEFYLVDYVANSNGKPVNFLLHSFPNLPANEVVRHLSFKNHHLIHHIKIKIDKTIIQLMEDYPIFSEKAYLETRLSPILNASLLSALRPHLAGKDTKTTLQWLLSFTRTAFNYKEDKEHFGRNKPMIADEVFFYAFSDCEDRSALFYNLVKEILQLPMIIVAYDDHLTIGVQLPENEGKPLFFQGRFYTICDPTGPSNSDQLGVYPKGYEFKNYQVIGSFR